MSLTLARQRRKRLRELCRDRGWDRLLVYGNAWRCDYLRYVSDFPILEGHGLAILESDGSVRLTLECAMEAERAGVEAPDCDVDWRPDLLNTLAAEVSAMAAAPGHRVAAAPLKLMPHGIVEAGRGRLADAGEPFDGLMMRKSDEEIAAVRRAAAMADEGYEVFLRAARPGRAEYELTAEVEAFFRSRGVPDNFMILGSGGREVRGMHPPGERRLAAGDLVTTELTPCVDGYYAQVCRTLVLGAPTAPQAAAFDLFRRSMEAGLAALRPGVTAAAVARTENDVFRAAGLGEYTTNRYTRVRGHGLGLYVDSRPALLEDVELPIEAGMTLIVHPNTYHPDVGYVVLGDSAIARAEGAEVLTATPRTLFSVGG
ncbi:MAG: aminopeptidase P family protein [Rubrivivax sp.]|nr:aminopeptidase P family protein [Rubrivivax sp.]